MKKLLIMIVALGLVLGGCANYRQIALEDVHPKKIRMAGITKADIELDLFVNNPTRAVFTVEDISGMVYKEGVAFARISMSEPFKVHPGTPSKAEAVLRVEIADPVSALVMGLDFKSWDISHFTVDAQVKVKGKGMKRTFPIKGMPLKELVEELKF